MRYYYLFPGKKQYFFPQNYQCHPFLLSFYTPYTIKGTVIWWLWQKLPFVKRLFSVKEANVPGLVILRRFIGKSAVLAINLGTSGPDQKTTAIGYRSDMDQRFFIKYAKSEQAKVLVKNEYLILKKLETFSQIPQIIRYSNNPSGILLQTSFSEGKKAHGTILTDKIFELILILANISIYDCIDNAANFEGKKCFAHGDFCPWNILVSNNHPKLIDWEMAGVYPAGYDIFTYIFQTSFLLHPKVNISQIIKKNTHYIDRLFSILKIKDWNIYLGAFAGIKLELETKKNNSRLIPHIEQLLEYALQT